MFTRLILWLRGVLDKMIGKKNIQQALQVDIEMSSEMASAIDLWTRMYENEAPWLSSNVKSMNLPAAIASEIARMVTIEMAVHVKDPYLQELVDGIVRKLREQVEYGVAKGGIIMKPYPNGDKINIDFVQADRFFPVSFDGDGDITACVFTEQKKVGANFYNRIEYHEFSDEQVLVRNKAFRSDSKEALGTEVELSILPDWEELVPEAIIENVERPLYAYFRYPMANNVDPTSPLGVSCFSRARDYIEEADRQWSRLLWEFESGERALYVDVLAFDRDDDGKPVIPNTRLYRTMKTAGTSKDDMFEDWSPSLREKELTAGLESLLRKIEWSSGLAYGSLSDAQFVTKTATEIISAKQRSASTVSDTQKALANSINDLLYSIGVWMTLSGLGNPDVTATYDFDDSIITDRDHQFSQDQQVVGMGAMSKLEFRMRNYNEDEATALKMLALAETERSKDAKENDPFGLGA